MEQLETAKKEKGEVTDMLAQRVEAFGFLKQNEEKQRREHKQATKLLEDRQKELEGELSRVDEAVVRKFLASNVFFMLLFLGLDHFPPVFRLLLRYWRNRA